MKKFSVCLAIILLVLFQPEKNYKRDYFASGVLKSEGWAESGRRTGYWKFYHPNGQLAARGAFEQNRKSGYWYFFGPEGNLEREGHYRGGKASDWWIEYDAAGNPKHKCQLRSGEKNGYCLMYREGELQSASQYRAGVFVKSWDDLASFKRDNRGKDLN